MTEKKHYHRGRRRRRRQKKGGIVGNIILIVAILVFIVSAFQLGKIYLGYNKGKSEYKELEKVATSTKDERFTVDFDALRELNPDVVAWIRFDEPAIINYPIVQGKDNSEYLDKTFQGYENTVGTIFVNVDNSPDFTDKNTIVYGHRMNNKTMFNRLEEYKEEEFYKKYPVFYIYTPDGAEIKYQIYSVGIVKDTSEGYAYQFADDAAFEAFLQTTKEQSMYDTGVELTKDAQVVTLSTCTKDNNEDRLVVHGVKTTVEE